MQNRIKYIYDILMATGCDPKHIISEYCSKFHKTERTFWSDYKAAKSLFDEFTAKEIERVNKLAEAKTNIAVSSGLKSKLERQLHIQSLLEAKMTEAEFIDLKTNKIVRYMRALEPREITAYHKELSLMGGDYAPNKVANSDVAGNDKEQQFTDYQVDKILDAIKNS